MALPYVFEENFELGTLGGFDSETDAELILNFRHYSTLARYDATVIGPIAPWRGAYCMEINLGGDANDHTLIKAGVVADTKTAIAGFYFFLGKNFTATADDTLNIFEFQSAAAVEGVVGLRITAATGAVEIGTGKVAPTVFATQPLTRGRWYCVELVTVVQTGGTGTSTVFLDGAQVAQVTTITNIALTTTAFGVRNALSTTSGHMFYDFFYLDDTGVEAGATRRGPFRDRYPDTIYLSKSQHICLGQSDLLNVTLLQGAGTDNALKIFDTDAAEVTSESNIVAHLYNLTASEPPIDLADVPVMVKRGAFVQLSGTSPRALIHIGCSQGYGSKARIRQLGYKRNVSQIATQ